MTAKKMRFARQAQLVQTLVYFDGPQVALLRTDRGLSMLAVHVEYKDMEHAMFACEISKQTLRKYLNERFDLKYVFTRAEHSTKHYFFDWASLSDRMVPLTRASEQDLEDEDFYPEQGFFARHHTREYVEENEVATEAQKYKIDGSWDASDFSRFYGRVSDLYAILSLASSNLAKSVQPVDIAFIKSVISQYFWKGGGSYVGFYDTLFERVHELSPLNVSKIRYASPGYIELNGQKDKLHEIDELMNIFDNRYDLLRDKYRLIDKTLKTEDLKRASPESPFSSKIREIYVHNLANELAVAMGVSDPDGLFNICSRNTLVFTKIVLSFYRRGKDLYMFHAEGRVQVSEEAIESVENL